MLLALLTFPAVLAIIVGGYWVFVVLPEGRDQLALRRRLKSEDPIRVRVRLLKEADMLSRIGVLNSLLHQAGGLSGPLKDWIDQSGLSMNVGTFVLVSLAAFFAAPVALSMFAPQLFRWLALPAGIVALLTPYFVVGFMRTRQIRKFEEQFPEAVELISRAMRAGHAFPTGLKMASDELPPPAGTEFKLLYERQNFGAELPDALRLFAQRIPSLDARFFVTAVLTQRETGGNLSEVLDRLAAVMRERFRVKREVRVRSAHGRITAWVLAGLPPTVALLMLTSSPQQLKILTTDPLGIRMIIGGVVLQLVGTLIVRKLVDIEY